MSNSNLPANLSDLAANLQAAGNQVSDGAGGAAQGPFMKMGKDGAWIFGKEEVEIEKGSTWAISPHGFQCGWIAWGTKAHGTNGKKMGEDMGPLGTPMMLEQDLPEVKGDWKKQISMHLVCLDGEDQGTKVVFQSNSRGGCDLFAHVTAQVVKAIQSGDAEIVPVVELSNSSYKHKNPEYGKIYTPIMKVVDWLDMETLTEMMAEDAQDEEEEEEEPKKIEEPKKRTRKAKPAKVEEEEEPKTEEEEKPARKRRTRRTA